MRGKRILHEKQDVTEHYALQHSDGRAGRASSVKKRTRGPDMQHLLQIIGRASMSLAT